jgi:cation diffusion facilitator CzcD-associated flavoprotein CzcO
MEDSMDTVPAIRHEARTSTGPEFDAVVIGAGVAGLYQLYRLRELGLRVRTFEAGSAVGGTWHWNARPRPSRRSRWRSCRRRRRSPT